MSKALSSYTPGSIIKLYEDGDLVEFYVSKHNYESELNGEGRTLLVRRYALQKGMWNEDTSIAIDYKTSQIDAYYSTIYLDKLDRRLRSVLGFTKIRIKSSGVSEEIVGRRIFGLSGTELGVSTSNTVTGDGTVLPISDILKIAMCESGTEVAQTTRSYGTTSSVIAVDGVGGKAYVSVDYASAYYRPAFTVPENLEISDDGILIGREKACALRETECGDIVALTEDGVQIDYVISEHNYGSELNGDGRTLLVRRDLYDAVQKSEIDASLNTWMGTLSDEIRSLIEPVKIQSRKVLTIETEEKDVFIPSWYELCGDLESEDFKYADGTILSVAPILRAPFYNGLQTPMWTRSVDNAAQGNEYIAAGTQPAYYKKGVAPTFTLPDTLYITVDGLLTTDAVPEISGNFTTGTDIGVQNAAVDIEYTAKGNDGDVITVKEYLDGVCKNTYTVASGVTSTVKCLAAENYQTVLNGDHTLEVVAYNGEAESEKFVITFSKKVTEATVSFEAPVEADDQITLAVARLVGSIPSDAEVSLLVTNNAKDADPVWEDATSSLRDGYNHVFTNTVATNGFAFNFRLTVSRGASDIGGYISSIGGAIQ